MKIWVLLERHEEQPKDCYSIVSLHSSLDAAVERKEKLMLDDEEGVWYYRIQAHELDERKEE